MTTNTKPDHVHETAIRATPQAVWQAMTSRDKTVDYYYGTAVESTWVAGEPIRYLSADDDTQVVADGTILEIEEPTKLVMSFLPRWDPELEAEGPVHMSWLVTDTGDGTCNVRVEYRDMDPDGAIARDFKGGIEYILTGLKVLLETGRPMATGG